jgi:transposase InsO family protein
MSLREEFVILARQPGANRSELARRFGISRKTAYKWLARQDAGGAQALANQSRRPRQSPTQTRCEVEQAIVQLRRQHPRWGARKLLRRLRDLGHADLPAPSTTQAILKRHGCIAPEDSKQHTAFVRFERERPNELWQMDFKGHFGLANGSRCHALTVLDDHARFSLGLRACANEQTGTVADQLRRIFRRYGLPESIGIDNGSPWGDSGGEPYTPLTVWFMRLQIKFWHSRPRHPQTLGKDERFHRTLKAELLDYNRFGDLRTAQRAFDQWRDTYNLERPHDALDGATPVTRYQPSPRPFPEKLPPVEYAPDSLVRKVDQSGHFYFHGRELRISKAFRGHRVGLRATTQDGVWEVYFCNRRIKMIDLR